MIAYAIDVEALGITAALGAFMAPVLLGRNAGQREPAAAVPRLHGGGAGAGRGPAAVAPRHAGGRGELFRRRPSRGARESAEPWGVLLFGVLGGAAGLYVGLSERWWETRFLTFSGGWALLAAASERMGPHWPVFAAGLGLSAPVWWHALRQPEGAAAPARAAGTAGGWSLGEALYFFTTPVLLGWAVYGLAPDRFDGSPAWLAPSGRDPLSPRRLPPAAPAVRTRRRCRGGDRRAGAVERHRGDVGAAGSRAPLGRAGSRSRPSRRPLVRHVSPGPRRCKQLFE